MRVDVAREALSISVKMEVRYMVAHNADAAFTGKVCIDGNHDITALFIREQFEHLVCHMVPNFIKVQVLSKERAIK